MSAAREEILRRVRTATRDVSAAERPEDVVVARDYDHGRAMSGAALVDRLTERLRDYGAEVQHVRSDDVASAVAQACAAMRCKGVVAPPALPSQWRPPGVEVTEDHGLSAQELDRIDGAVTGCAAAIAETGTLILDGLGVSGRRVLTLVPDHHICVVTEGQIVGSVPEAVTRVGPSVREQRVPVTLVSGPSATADIELSRVQGVHGPRHLFVVVVAS